MQTSYGLNLWSIYASLVKTSEHTLENFHCVWCYSFKRRFLSTILSINYYKTKFFRLIYTSSSTLFIYVSMYDVSNKLHTYYFPIPFLIVCFFLTLSKSTRLWDYLPCRKWVFPRIRLLSWGESSRLETSTACYCISR